MCKNVLIVEDHESASIALRKTLERIGILNPDYAYYCDQALTRIQKSLRAGTPYDLLITDLSFDEDDNRQRLLSGTDLIKASRQIQPGLKILVFSFESRPAIIDSLFRDHCINGYVQKARRDAEELIAAIEDIFNGKLHLPSQMKNSIRQKNAYEFTTFDIIIISQLSQGMRQKDIPAYLHQNQIRPSGLSSVEKRLSLIKEALNFSSNQQLAVYCKEMGII